MSAWTNGTYTHKGLALLAKLTQGTYLKVTKAVAGTGYVDPETLANQTTVSGTQLALTFRTASYPKTGTCKLPMFLTSKGIATSHKVRQIGLYAMDPDDGEILYFITQSSVGTTVPSEKEMPDYSATWTFFFQYGQADEVSVTVDPSNAITKDMLEEVQVIAEEGISTKAAGTIARHNNTAGLPFTGLRLFGKTTQNGTPTPGSPVDLVNAGASGIINVEMFGKNLCPMSAFNSMTRNGKTNTYDETTHTITMEADTPLNNFSGRYCRPLESKFVVGTQYAISFDIKGTPGKIVACGFDWGRDNITLTEEFQRHSYVYVAARSDEVVAFYTIATASGGLAAGEYMQFANVQIEAMAATDYEEYETKKTFTVSTPDGLPGVPTPSGGNYTDAENQQWICDEKNLASGLYLQRVNRFQVTSADNGKVIGATFRFSADLPIDAPYDDGKAVGYGLCSHLPFLNSYGTDTPHFYTQGKIAWIFLPIECGTTVAEVTEWLAAHPLDIIYQIATPVETPLSAEELTAYAALTANSPVTTVTNDAGAWMEVDCIKAQHEATIKLLLQQSGTALARKLLWTNDSPNAEFSSVVMADISGYSAIEILYYVLHEGSDPALKSTGNIPTGRGFCILDVASGSGYTASRTCYIMETSLEFYSCMVYDFVSGSKRSDNTNCVPYKIYGIKG